MIFDRLSSNTKLGSTTTMRSKNDPPLFLLDANACNALQRIEELNKLEHLAHAGKIDLMYTETTWDEAQFGSQIRRDKVREFFFVGLAKDQENSLLQQPWRKEIGRLVFPHGIKNDGQRRDIEALLTVKMSCGYFVSSDGGSKRQPGGILGYRSQLAILGIEVLNFTEALKYALQVVSSNDPNKS